MILMITRLLHRCGHDAGSKCTIVSGGFCASCLYMRQAGLAYMGGCSAAFTCLLSKKAEKPMGSQYCLPELSLRRQHARTKLGTT